ncbi:hypothetical protein CLIB1444_01S06480 [[Candida] jaroonii]|uniref:Uncharacterized protein n=1 Tax=[Candida] jaroonii TaxID=467808 RepID=A0ACA9Y0G8_9ASCO|nr:hypothetical protein CLIB1444_01S06480 [[Candida] jaroonii]
MKLSIILMFTTLVMAEVQRISLYGTGLSDKEHIELGHLEINKNNLKGMYLPCRIDSIDSEFCIGAKDIPGSECFYKTNDLSNKQFVVYIDNGKVDYLTIRESNDKHKVLVKETPKAPQPNLNPSNKPKKAPVEVKTVKTFKTDENGNKIEVTQEIEEPPKSWIQKNWTYIVPPLLILFVLMGDDKK